MSSADPVTLAISQCPEETRIFELSGSDALNELLQFLQQHPEVNILIKGFADPVVRAEDNKLAAIGGDIEALYLRHIKNYSLFINDSGLAAQNDNIKDWYNAA